MEKTTYWFKTAALAIILLCSYSSISQTLTWNTFLGGSGNDNCQTVVTDGSGNVYVVGKSSVTWGSPVRAYSGGDDGVVVKYDSDGTLIWNTFLGGNTGLLNDYANGVAVDASGNVYVTGNSRETWGTPLNAYSDDWDAFVAKLDSNGNLLWHTFLGGTAFQNTKAIAVDGSGNMYVTGNSSASWGSPVRAFSSSGDGFAAKLNSSGSLLWHTFLGGTGADGGEEIVLDGSGNVYVGGYSYNTWGTSPVRAYSSGSDAFAVKLSNAGALTWNTFLGGSGNDFGYSIALDGSDNLYVAGDVNATWGTPIRTYTSDRDAAVSKLNSSGSLVWNTFLGGSGYDGGSSIAIDASDNLYVSGRGSATWGTPERAFSGGSYDVNVMALDSSGSLAWNTFLGGSGTDSSYGIAVDGSGGVYVTGYSTTTWGSPLRAYSSSTDGLVAKINYTMMSISTAVTDEACPGTGVIAVTVTDGTAPYTYTWTNNVPDSGSGSGLNITSLVSGTYDIVVTDDIGGTGSLSNVVVGGPSALATSFNTTYLSSAGASDGAIDLTVSGGIPNGSAPFYTYSWTKDGSPFATTEDLTGLSAGTYAVTVTDACPTVVGGSVVMSATRLKQLYLSNPSQGLDRIDPVATADPTLATAIVAPISSTDVTGMAIWSGASTPGMNDWNGTSFGSSTNTGISNGDRWRIIQGAACPKRDEKIVVGIENGGSVSGQLWNGSNWNAISIGGSTDFGTPGATFFWGLETAYESQSGDALIVYGDGTNLRYSIWNGTTWSLATNITTCTSGTPYQMRLAANPNTDEMVLVVNYTNETECALVWNGSSWGNSVTLDNSTTQDRTDIFVAYEQQSGNALVVYEADTDVNAKYRIWNGSAWSAEATITAPSGPSGYARWMHLASQPGSNQIALGVLTTNSDVYFAIWDGSSWGNAVSATTSANGNTELNVSVAIESVSGDIMGAYGEGASTRYRTWNGSAWSAELTTPVIGGTSNAMELYASPLSDQIVLMVNDDNSDVNTITWNGTSWGAVTELEIASGETKNQPFVFIYDQNLQGLYDTLTFTQSPVMCSDLIIPSGVNISVTLYVDADPGASSVAELSIAGGSDFISMTSPIYNVGAGTATWTGTNSGNTIVNSGSAIELSISGVSTAVEIRFDSQTYPSKIDLPVTTYIDILSHAIYDAPYPDGNIITDGTINGTVYVRTVVSDPFGYDDITALDLNITPTVGVVSSASVATSGCSKTYEYVWNTPATGGSFNVEATAKEGYENTVTDVESTTFDICTDCPPIAVDDDATAAVGGPSVSINVLANDTDPNGNINTASLTVLSSPSYGTAVVTAGEIVYTPNGSYTGNDQFTYQICDNTSPTPLCDNAVVNINANVYKQLYLTDPSQGLDRIDPVASGDNTTALSGVLSAIAPQVVVDATSSNFGKPSVNTFSVSHNTGSGLNRLMLVGVSLKNRTVSTVTYGGTALTKVGEQIDNGNAKVYIYSLVSPTPGPANVVVTTSDKADKGIVVGVMTFTGVDQNTPLGTFASYQTKSTNPTLDVTSTVGDFVFDVVSIKSKDLDLVGTGQIQRWNADSGSDVTGGGSTELATSSLTTMSWTADSEDWAIGAIAIKPFISATSVSFTQTPALCDDLTITSGETITVSNYVSIESGTMPSSPSITAVLKYGATNIITLNNPTYSGGVLTWTSALGSDVTVPAGQAIQLVITTAQTGVTFKIDYDSQTKPSKIDLPVSTYIDITAYDIYDAPYPGGSIITSAEGDTGTLVYLRAEVTDPFGAYDITDLSIDNQGTPVTATVVATTSCTKTYEYALSTPLTIGIYTYVATAKEGLENTVTDSESLDLTVTFDGDGDGVLDSVDIDDDNDGIKDTDEGLTLDSDGDTIPNLLDLDSDNDGIPDIVEAGLGSISAGTATIPSASFIDANNNGMHDPFETNVPLDSDGDGTPNFKDLDSDNDANFDVDEARTERTEFGKLVFENGDGDINGDGVGDGDESEAFRKKDDDNDGTVEYFGDGILDIYDQGTGVNEYGNLSQGSAPYFVNDSDNDGVPDYIDTTSDGSTFDISYTHYAEMDGSNNDGKIDDTVDSDEDGLMDSFDTNDTAFGSPRYLEGKFDLFFDGRNDYVEDTAVIDGWSEATLMAWIKIDPAASGDQIIFGQNSFYIQLNSDKTISANANGNTVFNSNSINTNQWTHVAASYSNTNSLLKIYINGTEISSTAVSGALPSDSSSLTLGRQPDTDSKYFNGYIDEARVFFKALATDELQKMVYQEIEENSGSTKGSVIPIDVKNTSVPLPWNTMKRYYRMDAYKDDVLDDLTTPGIDEGSGARIYNTKLIKDQTAPLPFVTTQSGKLDVAVNDPVRGINGADAINNESAIVKVAHNDVYVDTSLKQVGLMIDAQDAGSNPIEFSVKNDSELNVSWYLELDGKLDLEGESQLVQGDGSILDADSSGYIEKDQQGTANSYNYNYWSSSVGPIGATGARGTASTNNDFILGGVLLDGSTADNGVYPRTIDFQWHYTAADYGNSDPITISTYWLWKYHGTSDDYGAWQKIWPNTPLLPGEGYTMKGSSGSVPITSEQNYAFRGKPNNGDFTLPITPGNDRLIGNPYPSAMDTEEFIKDNLGTTDGGNNTNGNVFNGALYFWDHFGSVNSHYLGNYVGGYATRNLIGGAPAIANDQRINATGGSGTKIPGRYIPVNQGFFVLTSLDEDLTGLTTVYGGDIVFKNSQRVFKTEATSNSVFMRNSGSDKKEDNTNPTISARASDETENDGETRPLIRLNFDSPTGTHRQILAGVDKNASNSFDLGYDALLPDLGAEDLFWTINDTQFVIQGVDNFDTDQELPLGLLISEEGIARISVHELENIDPSVRLYIKDELTEETYDITNDPFEIELAAGEYYERFSLVFQPRLKTLDEVTLEQGVIIYMNDSNTLLQINRILDTKIESIRLYNSLGQSFNVWETNLEGRNLSLPVNNLSTGMYIVQLVTSDGDIIKKMLVE